MQPQRHNNLSQIDNHRLPGSLLLVGKQDQPTLVDGALVIQLPTTSASVSPNSPVRPPSASTTTVTNNQRVNPHQAKYFKLHNAHQQQQQPTVSSNCHHQAATRDLMLMNKNHNQHHHLYRHRYFQRLVESESGSNLAAFATTTDLEHQYQQQQQQQQHQQQQLSDNNSDQANGPQSITPPPNYHEIPGIVPSYHGRTSGPPPAYDEVINPHASPPTYQSLFGQVREARKTSNGLVDLLRQLFLVLIGTIGCTMIIGFLLLIPITMILVGFFYINECRAENIPSFLVVGGFVWIIKNMLNCYNQFKRDSQTINRPPPPPAGRRAPTMVGNQSLLPTTTTTSQVQQVAASSATSSNSRTGTSTTGGGGGGSSRTAATTATTTATTATTTSSNQRHIGHPQMIGLTSYKCESFLNYFLVVWFLAGCIVVYRIYEPDYDNPLSLSYCNRTVYLYAFWLMTSAFIIMALVLSCLCCLMASSLMSCNHGR